MVKKDKDFFESTLSDVVPLKKKQGTESTDLKKSYEENTKKNYKGNAIDEKKIKKTTEQKPQNFLKKTDFNQASKFSKKLKKGKIKIDKTVDLHGYKLFEAENKFDEEIYKSYIGEHRCILFITGKGLRSKKNNNIKNRLYFGVIRSNIEQWSKKTTNQEKILYKLDNFTIP